ncbi:tetratricopeptide repeat protein [candidate division WOR-3 bacterium]|nr:tetratricopeptide repeat protein [candidate division WOR-3 bacterium]
MTQKISELSFSKKFLFFTLLFLVVVITYSPSLFNGLCYDDITLIEKNALVKNFDIRGIFSKDLFNITRGESPYYRPLIPLVFAIENLIWSTKWGFYHLDNIVLHFLASLLVYKLVKRILSLDMKSNNYKLFKTKKPKDEKSVFFWSISSAFFFALHPANSQTVYWLSARGDLFVTLAVLTGCVWIGKKSKWAYLILPVSFFLALFSKETGVLFLLVLALYYFLFLRDKITVQKVLFYALSVLPVFLLYLFLRKMAVSVSPFTPVDESFWTRDDGLLKLYMTIPSILGYYVFRTIFPYFLNFETGINLFRSALDVQFIFGLICAVFSFAALYFYRKNRLFLWGFLFWFLPLLPVMNFIPMFESGMEHYLYLPVAGLSILPLFVFFKSKLTKAVWILLLISFSLTVYLRGSAWKNNLTLFTDSSKKTGENCKQGWIRSRNNLGTAYLDLAIGGFDFEVNVKKADSLYSEITDAYPDYGGAYIGRGDVAYVSLDYQKAIQFYSRALEIYPRNYFLMNKLGIVHSCLGDYSQAEKMFGNALEINPGYVDPKVNLAKIFFIRGQVQAASELLDGLPETPSTEGLVKSLKLSISASQGFIDRDADSEDLITAVEILAEAGMSEEKLALAEVIHQRFPSDSDALYNLSLIYLSDMEDFESGLEKLRQGDSQFPADYRFKRELAVFYVIRGDSVSAAYYFGRVLELSPENPEAERMKDFIEKVKN